MKGSDPVTEAKIAALKALGLLPKGGLTVLQWKVLRTLRSDGELKHHWLEYMAREHRYFRSKTLPSMIDRGLITDDLKMTADGMILMRHLELEAKKRLWERKFS
jgi:hypothetical protein